MLGEPLEVACGGALDFFVGASLPHCGATGLVTAMLAAYEKHQSLPRNYQSKCDSWTAQAPSRNSRLGSNRCGWTRGG